jgi:hypothetical protein
MFVFTNAGVPTGLGLCVSAHVTLEARVCVVCMLQVLGMYVHIALCMSVFMCLVVHMGKDLGVCACVSLGVHV